MNKNFLVKIFNRTRISEKYIDILTNDRSINIFKEVFTLPLENAEKNYELYEFIGDLEINNHICWYFYIHYPQLRKIKHVKILSRIKIMFTSTDILSDISKKLEFDKYLNLSKIPPSSKNKNNILEDVFEAFVGAMKVILTDHFNFVGVSSQIIQDFIVSIFDERDIQLTIDTLFDDKSRLKELFDYNMELKEKYGSPEYKILKDPEMNRNRYFTTFTKHKKKFEGFGDTRKKAQKDASRKALIYLEKKGYNIEKKFDLFIL